MRFGSVVLTVVALSLPTLPQKERRTTFILRAPTYYIVVDAHLQDDSTIIVRGASSLPTGSRIAIQAGDGTEFVSESNCASVGEEGFFVQNLRPAKGVRFKWSPNLGVDAVFRTTECQQPKSVLQIVGKHGQYLGNDNYENKIDVHMQMTPGMNKNPQLFQESGWYYGLRTLANVSQ